MVQSREELGLSRIAKAPVAQGQSESGAAVYLRHQLPEMLEVAVSNLGSRTHDQSTDEDDAILAVPLTGTRALVFFSAVEIKEPVSRTSIKLLAEFDDMFGQFNGISFGLVVRFALIWC